MRRILIIIASLGLLSPDVRGADFAPDDIQNRIVTSVINSQESVLVFGPGGEGEKTKDGTTTPIAWSEYSASGNTATVTVEDGGFTGITEFSFGSENLGTFTQMIDGLGFRFGMFTIRSGFAPASLIGQTVTSFINGETSALAFEAGGTGTKTKDGVETSFTWSNYATFGDVATFDIVDGISGSATLTFQDSDSGIVDLSSTAGEKSGTFVLTDTPDTPPMLETASLADGKVTFTFNEPMDTSMSAFDWNSSLTLDSSAFSNFGWNGDATSFSFDAAFPNDLTITFVLNPSAQSGHFRNTGGTLLAPDTTTQEFTVTVPPTLESSSLADGTVTFEFSEPMNTGVRQLTWTSSEQVDESAFSNFTWNGDATSLSFDADLAPGSTITFILNPSGQSEHFRDLTGNLLAADTSTQQFMIPEPEFPAPTSLAGLAISATTTSATGAFADSVGQTVIFSFASDGTGTKTKDESTTEIAYANYSASGETGTFDLTDSGKTGQVALTFTSTSGGSFSLSVSGAGTQSGTFSLIDGSAPELVSSSLIDGVVTFTFNEPMDTNWRSFSWNSSQQLPAGTFSNFRWNQGATTISFDADLPEGLNITFILNPTGFSGNFRDAGGTLLAADTPTQQFTVVSRTNNMVLSLDGAGDYVTIPSSSAIQPAEAFTIEAWIFPIHNGANHNPHFINKGDGRDGDSQRSYELVFSTDGKLVFHVFFQDSTFAVPRAPVEPEQWVHFAGTFDSQAGEVRIYINGELKAMTTQVGAIPLQGLQLRQTSLPLVLGFIPSHTGTYGTGELDELRIWNVARTGEQIAATMRSRLSGSEPNLVAYWNFDDGAITDLTGGGLNGTRTGNASASEIIGNDFPHAARLVSAIRQGDSTLDLTFESETNRTHRIEYTEDLKAWSTLTTVTSTDSPMTVTDSTAPPTRRFYRIISP